MAAESWTFVLAVISALGGVANVLELLEVRLPLARLIAAGKPTIGKAVLLSTVSLVLSTVGFYGSLRGGGIKPLGAIMSFGDPTPTNLEVPFVAGRPARFNLRIKNNGPEQNAGEVSWAGMVALLPVPVSPDDERRRYDEFRRSATLSHVGDMPIPRTVYRTFATRTLTERDVSDIRDGRQLLYIFGLITYKDTTGNHETQFCSYLQPPGTGPYWLTCEGILSQTR